MLGGERNNVTFGRIKYKFRTSSNKNTVRYKILVNWKGADSEVVFVNFMKMFYHRGMWSNFSSGFVTV